MSHYETSPREKEDEARRDEHEFGTEEMREQDERDRILLARDTDTYYERGTT
jgi:hypothetical protein